MNLMTVHKEILHTNEKELSKLQKVLKNIGFPDTNLNFRKVNSIRISDNGKKITFTTHINVRIDHSVAKTWNTTYE